MEGFTGTPHTPGISFSNLTVCSFLSLTRQFNPWERGVWTPLTDRCLKLLSAWVLERSEKDQQTPRLYRSDPRLAGRRSPCSARTGVRHVLCVFGHESSTYVALIVRRNAWNVFKMWHCKQQLVHGMYLQIVWWFLVSVFTFSAMVVSHTHLHSYRPEVDALLSCSQLWISAVL